VSLCGVDGCHLLSFVSLFRYFDFLCMYEEVFDLAWCL